MTLLNVISMLQYFCFVLIPLIFSLEASKAQDVVGLLDAYLLLMVIKKSLKTSEYQDIIMKQQNQSQK